MTLYELSDEYSRLMSIIEGDEGEITEETEKMLDAVTDSIYVKRENICKIIRNTSASAESKRNEAERLTASAKRDEVLVDRLTSYLAMHTPEPVDAGIFRISYRASKSVEISCPVLSLPMEYRRVKIVDEADKSAIKAAIESGIKIDGAAIVEKRNIQIK